MLKGAAFDRQLPARLLHQLLIGLGLLASTQRDQDNQDQDPDRTPSGHSPLLLTVSRTCDILPVYYSSAQHSNLAGKPPARQFTHVRQDLAGLRQIGGIKRMYRRSGAQIPQQMPKTRQVRSYLGLLPAALCPVRMARFFEKIKQIW
jgi:hypothetical protein